MEPSFLKQLVNVEPYAAEEAEGAPYSYTEWKKRLPSIIEKNSTDHYNSYVIKWFSKNNAKSVSRKFLLRQKYLYLLDQLQLVFSTEEKNTWYNNINLADERELLHAIPYFARKLKDISLYYLDLRRKLKNTKYKYNRIGSVKGITEEIYRYLLDTVSLKDQERSPELQSTLPRFSDLQNKLTVNIEELYDDKQYFDISPTNPLSGYYNLLDDVTAKYFATKGIVLSSSDWLFESFDVPVTSDNFTTLIAQVTGSVFEITDAENYTNFVQKYLAENKHLIDITPELSSTSIYEFNISSGNNYFIYPYGTSSSTFSFKTELPLKALSSTYIGPATAGITLEDSDVMIVKYGNESKAAWYRYIEYEETSKTMNATIKRDVTTTFIYPFPGYGLSAEDSAWSGSSFDTNPEYNFLSIELKAQVNQAYWSQKLPVDTCSPILLNNSTLISSGAIANKDPRFADQIYIRQTRSTDTTAPRGELSAAWLYRFNRTALPVSTTDENIFLWPYTKIDINVDFPEYLTEINFAKACNPVSIQNILNAYFVAASSINAADKIYKLSKPDDAIEDALECSWLSGSVTETADYNSKLETGIQTLTAGGVNGYRYVNQDGFNALFTSGETVRFIWTGPETLLDQVFKPTLHREDCPYITNIPALKSKYDWEKCTCKQVYHVPIGHSAEKFAEGNYLADCIFQVPDQELLEIDFGSWVDKKDQKILDSWTSSGFGWYSTKQVFGGGKWRSDPIKGQSNPLILYTGKAYVYRRAKSNMSGVTFPPYAVNYNFLTNSRTKWIQAKKTPQGEWVSVTPFVSSTSTMVFYPGDILKIDSQQATTHTLLSSIIVESQNENTGSIWSTYDKLVFKCDEQTSTLISWPGGNAPFDAPLEEGQQYPPATLRQLSSIDAWSITEYKGRRNRVTGAMDSNVTQFIDGLDVITFIPPAVGTYFVSVTATTRPEYGGKKIYLNRRKLNQTTLEWEHSRDPIGVQIAQDYGEDKVIDLNNIIPDIVVVEQYPAKAFAEISFSTPKAGFLIEHPLKGWNYNTIKADPYGSGARPYWAIIDTRKNSTTRQKGVYSWGYPDEYIDEYLPNYNPIISPLELEYGNTIEYSHRGKFFNWKQHINYKQYANYAQWCLLSANLTKASNLSALYQIKKNIEPIAIPSLAPTNIMLSNYIEGAPLEVYYYALNPFRWSVSYVETTKGPIPSLSSYFIADTPWANLSNRFFPTIANVPVIEEVYSIKDSGGYFLPQNLGASQFINRNFDVFIKPEYALSATTVLAESVDIHIGGRGLTKQDQFTIFDWKENNEWLKESSTAGELAGYVKKSLTKNLQTFIPYQSNIQETTLGLVTPKSRYVPWGGLNDEEWTDKTNEPRGFTGVVNVSSWVESQVLKQNQHVIDRWSSDIYGNQYGLYKPYDPSNTTTIEQSDVYGELWVRLNNQKVLPASKALSAVFAPFKGLSATKETFNGSYGDSFEIYDDLISNRITNVECYFDTLFIKTPNIVIFTKIEYNYENQTIEMVFDDARYLALKNNTKHEKNWFFSNNKTIISLFTQINKKPIYSYDDDGILLNSYNEEGTPVDELQKNVLTFSLYELNLVTRSFKKIFDLSGPDIISEKLEFDSISNASLSYNKELNTFLITYMGTDLENKQFFVDYYIKNDPELILIKNQIYQDLSNQLVLPNPPAVFSQYLSTVDVGVNQFVIAVSASNNPSYYKLLNYQDQITVDNQGVFVGTLLPGIHFVNYVVGNSGGETRYGLTLEATRQEKAQVYVDIQSQTGSQYANLEDGYIQITFYGTLSSYRILYSNQVYTAAPKQTITLSNLHTGIYELTIQDDYFGNRPLNIIVGYTGFATTGIVQHQPVKSEIQYGYPLKTLFDI